MIREANKGDVLNLVALSIEVWLHTYAKDGIRNEISKHVLSTYTVKYFEELLGNPDYKILVAIENQHLVGYIVVNLVSFFESELNGYEVDTLYVQEHFHGKGVGRNLLSEVKAQFGSSLWISTWVQNKEAIGFYKYLGFKDIGSTQFDLEGEQHENRVLATRSSF